MGGIAFSLKDSRGLNTPRMPPTIYRFVRDQCHAALRQRFLAVASPIEAPAKKDYGDVDIFVAWDTQQTPLGNFEDIGQLLGASYTRVANLVNCDAQFAVLWPEALDELGCNKDNSIPRYCQIDLHICKNIEEFHWTLWYYAHGDLKPMIYSLLQPFGLTISTKGLFLRIPEIRNGEKKIFITNEPSEAIRLLGYAPFDSIWESEFKCIDELFRYTANCRFFKGFNSTELTGEDGRVMAVRETFKSWIADFIPTCLDGYPNSAITKEQLSNEILERFPRAKIEYVQAFRKLKRRQQRDLVTNIIEPAIPANKDVTAQWRRFAATALKDIIVNSDYSLGFAPKRSIQDKKGLYVEEEVRTFIEETWKVVGDAAWKRHAEPEDGHSQHPQSETGEIDDEDYCSADETSSSEDSFEGVKIPPRPEGLRQTWYESDMNDL